MTELLKKHISFLNFVAYVEKPCPVPLFEAKGGRTVKMTSVLRFVLYMHNSLNILWNDD
jgi:hypothetical protein